MVERMAVQMAVQMVERMVGQMVERLVGRLAVQMAGRMAGYMVVQLAGHMEVDPVTLAPLNGTIAIWYQFRCKTCIYENREMGDETIYR